MRARSIRSQLLLWLLIPLLALSAVKLYVSHVFAARRSVEIYDEILRNSADSVIARIDCKDSKVTIDFPSSAQAQFRHNESDKFWYKITRRDGSFLAGDKAIPSIADAQSDKITYQNSTINGDNVRIISMPYTPQKGDDLIVSVAETGNSRKGMAAQVLYTQVWMQLLVIVGGLIAVLIGVTRGLAPLEEIRKAMSSRSPFDLRPLEVANPPKEVTPLIEANNLLLRQLKNHLDVQQDFASNAAHQLRTPLTGLKTYVSLGARLSNDEKLDEIFVQLNTGVNRMTHLVNRLLSLARVERRVTTITTDSEIDLNNLAGEAIDELIGLTLEKQLTVEFMPSLAPALVSGDVESVRELIDNLVHNAICYTPKNGEIKIAVVVNETVSLIVEDSGPGIPLDERERVFERFYRMRAAPGEGSGLGLAIVKEIVETHSAAISIDDADSGCGCKITVTLARRPVETSTQIPIRKVVAALPSSELDLSQPALSGPASRKL